MIDVEDKIILEMKTVGLQEDFLRCFYRSGQSVVVAVLS